MTEWEEYRRAHPPLTPPYYINITKQAHVHGLSGEASHSHPSSSASHGLEVEATGFTFDCCRLEGPVELYDGGSELIPPASKSLIASSFSIRPLESARRRPGLGVLNRGTPSLLRTCALWKAAVFLEGMAKIVGSKNVIPLGFVLSLL